MSQAGCMSCVGTGILFLPHIPPRAPLIHFQARHCTWSTVWERNSMGYSRWAKNKKSRTPAPRAFKETWSCQPAASKAEHICTRRTWDSPTAAVVLLRLLRSQERTGKANAWQTFILGSRGCSEQKMGPRLPALFAVPTPTPQPPPLRPLSPAAVQRAGPWLTRASFPSQNLTPKSHLPALGDPFYTSPGMPPRLSPCFTSPRAPCCCDSSSTGYATGPAFFPHFRKATVTAWGNKDNEKQKWGRKQT